MNQFKKIENFIKFHRPIVLGASIFSYICLVYAFVILPWTEYWKIFSVYYLVGCAEQLFHHRRFAHKSWHAPRWLDIIGLWIANQSLLGNSIVFSAQHRLHHKFADTELDPHSPLYLNRWKIQFLYPYHNFSLKYAYDLLNDKVQIFFSKYGLLITACTWFLIIMITSINWFLTIWMPGVALVVLIKNYLNSRLHGPHNNLGNYRTIPLNDESNNNLFWGYFAFDGWHQNHHKIPNSWYIGNKWWEIDIPGIIIGILSILTLNFDNFKKCRVK